MKTVLLLAVFGLAIASKMALDAEIIREVNHHKGWKAGFNKRFANVTLAEAKKLCGTKLDKALDIPRATFNEKIDLPTDFDSRQKWPGKIHPIRNQEQCGSCWAFGATEALSDRIAIQGGANVVLSPQQLVSCDTSNYGCEGGYLNLAWQYMQTTGVVSDE